MIQNCRNFLSTSSLKNSLLFIGLLNTCRDIKIICNSSMRMVLTFMKSSKKFMTLLATLHTNQWILHAKVFADSLKMWLRFFPWMNWRLFMKRKQKSENASRPCIKPFNHLNLGKLWTACETGQNTRKFAIIYEQRMLMWNLIWNSLGHSTVYLGKDSTTSGKTWLNLWHLSHPRSSSKLPWTTYPMTQRWHNFLSTSSLNNTPRFIKLLNTWSNTNRVWESSMMLTFMQPSTKFIKLLASLQLNQQIPHARDMVFMDSLKIWLLFIPLKNWRPLLKIKWKPGNTWSHWFQPTRPWLKPFSPLDLRKWWKLCEPGWWTLCDPWFLTFCESGHSTRNSSRR